MGMWHHWPARGFIRKKQGSKFSWWLVPSDKTCGEFLLKLYHAIWIVNVYLKRTSNVIIDRGRAALTKGEFLRHLWLWMLMGTCIGWICQDFWRNMSEDEFDFPCPYVFNSIMSWSCIEEITKQVSFTTSPPQSSVARFWEVQVMLAAWNLNMTLSSIPRWIVCLDKSMSICFQHWMCPGWVFINCKTHPFGNEYNTAWCGLTDIFIFNTYCRREGRTKRNWGHLLWKPRYYCWLFITNGIILLFLWLLHSPRFRILCIESNCWTQENKCLWQAS